MYLDYNVTYVPGLYPIHLNSLMNMDFDRALEAGIEYAKLIAMLPDYKALMGDRWNLNEPVDIDGYLQNLDKGFYEKWFDSLSAFILEPMTMFFASAGAFVRRCKGKGIK